MRRILLVPLAALAAAFPTAPSSRTPPAMSGTDSLTFGAQRTWRYLVHLPEGYERGDRTWPLVVFLHGAGERGADLGRVAVHGPPRLVAEGRTFPFILVSPQCEAGAWWDGREIDAFVGELARRYRVDTRRVYLTGLSMGGSGTWAAATENPGRYAAIAPVCGAGGLDPALVAARLKDVPVWAFHGAKDPVVPVQRSQERVDAIVAAGGNARLTVYPEAGHDSWTETYANPALYEWLLAQVKR